jgi:translocation and assembly module TamB
MPFNKKKILYLSLLALILVLLLAAGRTQYVSDNLKAVAIPELEAMTGKKVSISSIYINILPFFVEIHDAAIMEDSGRRLFSAARVKGYVSLTGLLGREIVIKRLTADDVNVGVDEKQIEEVGANIKKYLAKEREDSFKLKARSVLLNRGQFDLFDGDKRLSVNAPYAEVLIPGAGAYRFSLRDIKFSKKGLPEIVLSADSSLSVSEDNNIDIKDLKVEVQGSKLRASGKMSSGTVSGELDTEADILAETAKSLFNLAHSGEGSVSVSGKVRLAGVKSPADISLDLRVKGDLHIETLMEILKVDEKIEGRVEVKGEVKGPLNDLRAGAMATLYEGNLFGVAIDRVDCNIGYGDKKMTFSDGDARLYGGTARAEAMITLPVVVYYTFSVEAKGINSNGIFELIKWDPHIGGGKVDGNISSEGSAFNPKGVFAYRKDPGGYDVLKRIASVDGSFSMTGKVINFPQLQLSTGVSAVTGSGFVDLNKEVLAFRAEGSSADLYDLSAPYFKALRGPGYFTAKLAGAAADPTLEVRFASNNVSFNAGGMDLPHLFRPHAVQFVSVQGDVNYKKNLLVVNDFRAVSGGMTLRTRGRIGFQKAKRLFDIISPEYDLKIDFDNGDLGELAAMIQNAPEMKGAFNCGFTLKGVGERSVAAGSFAASDLVISDSYAIDKAEASLSFAGGNFDFRSLILKKGAGVLTAKGSISLNKQYTISAGMNNLEVRDAMPSSWRTKMGDGRLKTLSLSDITINGKGSLSNPELDISGVLRYRDAQRAHASGTGKAHLGIRNRELVLSGNLMGDKIRISGSARLSGQIPWRAELDFRSARTDFLASIFVKEVPEDLLVNLNGNVRLWGDRDNVNGSVYIDKAYLYGFGYGFTNSSPISVKLQDKRLDIESFTMKNELAEVQILGNAILGRSYNLEMKGGSSLAPLRAWSGNIDLLKGDASFDFRLTGAWDKPRINGVMDISNGALGLKKAPHRLTAVNARIVADGDKIVLKKATGSISGGAVTMTGTAFLDRFRLRRFFLDSEFSDVTISVSKNFWVHSNGRLSYHGDSDYQAISGDINISKARYTERIDWKSWLIQTSKAEPLRMDFNHMNQTGLNVRINGSNLSVDNNVLRAAMKMDILLKGTVGQPAVLGRIESLNGIVYFRNNEFNIIKGVVDFAKANEIKPFFDILAETRVRDYSIRLALDGYLDQFNLSLTATPSLDEGDILSLLAAGDLSKNLKGMQGGIGAGEATSFLTGKLQDVAEERLRTVTGLDRLQIDPSVSRRTGSVSPRVTISKRILNDRLYATYSASADVEEGQIIKLEYMLNKHTSLIGVRDERGGIGADIKFRFQFK